MAQTKQNLYKGVFQSKQRRSLKNLYESNNFYSTTQTLFPSKISSIRQKQVENVQSGKGQFYKTLGSEASWGGWVRPQSKQASRKIITRPETSKGFRKQPSNNVLFLNLQNERLLQKKSKAAMNSKRNSKNIQKQQYCLSKKVNEPEYLQQIEIVVNKRPFDASRRRQSVHKNKFQTDLDDQFLQLFAD